MPIFAAFLGSIASALAGFFATFMGYKAALKLASYTAWLAIFSALLVSVYVCMSALYAGAQAMITGSSGSDIGWISYFFMALGMFIPANAGAVVACVASVWIGTGIYKFQKDAAIHFGSG